MLATIHRAHAPRQPAQRLHRRGVFAFRRLSADTSHRHTDRRIDRQEQQWSWHLPKQQVLGSSPFFIGCGFIIRRALFKDLGWYPDNFFLYQNEIDVSFKVRLQGYDIIYDPECLVIHRGTPNQRPGWRRVFFPTRNTLWLIRRYYPQPLASYMLLSRIMIGFYSACAFGQFGYYIKAVREGLTSPVEKTPLSATLRNEFLPFCKQNSLIHQLFKRT